MGDRYSTSSLEVPTAQQESWDSFLASFNESKLLDGDGQCDDLTMLLTQPVPNYADTVLTNQLLDGHDDLGMAARPSQPNSLMPNLDTSEGYPGSAQPSAQHSVWQSKSAQVDGLTIQTSPLQPCQGPASGITDASTSQIPARTSKRPSAKRGTIAEALARRRKSHRAIEQRRRDQENAAVSVLRVDLPPEVHQKALPGGSHLNRGKIMRLTHHRTKRLEEQIELWKKYAESLESMFTARERNSTFPLRPQDRPPLDLIKAEEADVSHVLKARQNLRAAGVRQRASLTAAPPNSRTSTFSQMSEGAKTVETGAKLYSAMQEAPYKDQSDELWYHEYL